ncbi:MULTISPECIES: Na/Pi cotransporter family protein [Aliiglaciecola]|uniref:Na/Pi cotransporter family protein n=1 Tax=Aliiglaciecola TaxID=1406885 RepID=UPI001C0A18EB|nr:MULTISPECIES: Na/Pi symporter [Aliiglaciecola]MBU2876323.1 Na/Pi symporter [Aliiglaciecola lipolytica]MDO6710539.1 Na/Pi symporter [Aliiglaciecola sp. 2_MG-2023]MDO6751596.1 Na/Pi symporter [Aliiglaciecola sp. 1_MG-2023]
MTDKWTLFAEILGGVGLFLLGMIVMTDGLKDLAGKLIRVRLMEYTRSPYSGALCGALSTAILQSSSAVTVATVGFVRAGLMTFSHSLGVIFGANIGTTITGWLVLLFGFKLKLGVIAFPLIFSGALLRLFAKTNLAALGLTIAGFGLIFVGITELQQSMSSLRDFFSFEGLSVSTLLQKLTVLGFAILFTLVIQSSSAGVAAALTALYSDLIDFEVAATLVIGMDIGTTVTALMATTGASIAAKRTGYSHVIYNLFTGVTALMFVTPFVVAWEYLTAEPIVEHAEIALITFHSTFNLLGIIIVLPFSNVFAKVIERLIRSNQKTNSDQLDDSILNQPSIALDLALDSLRKQMISLLKTTSEILQKDTSMATKLVELQTDIDVSREFIDSIPVENSAQQERLLNMIHTLDHMQRLHERCEELPSQRFSNSLPTELNDWSIKLNEAITTLVSGIEQNQWSTPMKKVTELYKKLNSEHREFRHNILTRVTNDEFNIVDATNMLDAFRWLVHVAQHIERCANHLSESRALTNG